ncbi:MAG: hypothetical protein ACOYN2_01425 [Patescibacteria group bacterium]
MNTRNTLAALLVAGSAVLVTTAVTFADEHEMRSDVCSASTCMRMHTMSATGGTTENSRKEVRMEMRSVIHSNLDTIASNWKNFHMEDSYLKTYIRTDLTKTEKQKLKADLKTYRDTSRAAFVAKMKDLKTQYSTTTPDLTAIKADIYTAIDTQMTGLKTVVAPYLATDKSAAFDKFITDRTATMKSNADLRLQNIQTRTTLKQSRK